MLVEIERFVNWIRRRNPDARTWRDYGYDLKQFVAVVGDRPPDSVTFYDVDRFVTAQVGQQHQLDSQSVAIGSGSSCSSLASWMTLAECLDFTKQHLESLLMQIRIRHSLRLRPVGYSKLVS